MKTDNFECESCRVTEDDSNDEKSGTEVDSCVKGSRTRKAVHSNTVAISSDRVVLADK